MRKKKKKKIYTRSLETATDHVRHRTLTESRVDAMGVLSRPRNITPLPPIRILATVLPCRRSCQRASTRNARRTEIDSLLKS